MLKNNTNIAIIPKNLLGDGLLFLILANNLQKNGYKITYYHETPRSKLRGI